MGQISWIKLATNMFEDEKIKLIQTLPDGNSIVLFWIKLLTLAGKTNDKGLIYLGNGISYNDEMLATITNLSTSVVRSGIKTLEEFGMIEITEENYIQVVNWTKHQNIEGMERVRDGGAERQRVWYYRKQLEKLGIDANGDGFPDDSDGLKELYNKIKRNPNVRLTLANGPDEDEDEEEDKDIDIDIDTSFIQGQNDGLYVLPLKNNKNFYITEKYINQLSEHFESLNLHNEILMMGEWLSEDESRLKDENYMNTFIENWLSQSLENKTKGKREKERSRK